MHNENARLVQMHNIYVGYIENNCAVLCVVKVFKKRIVFTCKEISDKKSH